MKKGLLIVISGASGTGKGTVCKELLTREPAIAYSISATSRAPREGEQDGREYYFRTREEFEAMIADGAFLEYADVYGNYYGTPLAPIEVRPLMRSCADALQDAERSRRRALPGALPQRAMRSCSASAIATPY